MRKIKNIILIYVTFILFSLTTLKAEEYTVNWENYHITIEVNANLDDYINLPSAKIYRNDKLVECQITYFKGVDYTTLYMVKTTFCDEYRVVYQANFSINNRVFYTHKKDIVFNVVDTTKPVIVENKVLEIDLQNIAKLDYISGLKIKDNYTDSENLIISYEKINLQVGDNKINYLVCDEKNNCTNFTRIIRVIDLEKPNAFLLTDHLILDINQKYNLLDNIIYKDNSKEVYVSIIGDVQYNKIGIYPIVYRVYDIYNNELILNCDVEIKDRIGPNISFSDNLYIDYDNIEKIEEEILKTIININDNVDTLTLEDIEINYNFNKTNFSKNIEVILQINDLSNNFTIYEKIYTIINTPLPTLVCENLVFNITQRVNPLKDVIAYDFFKKDISDRVTIKSSNINENQVGNYEVILEVEDDFSQISEVKRLITIVENTEEKKEKILQGVEVKDIILLSLISLMIIYIINKKFNKNSKKY